MTLYQDALKDNNAVRGLAHPEAARHKAGMSELHVLLAHRVLDHLRRAALPAGHHLTEQSLEAVLGASRSPIRGALAQLARAGVIRAEPPRRGWFLAHPAAELPDPAALLPAPAEEAAYQALARDRLAGRLPATLSETEGMRRTGLTRDRLRRVLERAAQEGWIERRPSKGWAFLPMIDGPDSYAESYALRRALEPAAMMMDSFAIDSALLRRLRREQEPLAERGWREAAPAILYAANAAFHEGLARLSGNRFVVQAMMRQNQLRRLVEYEEIADRDRVRRQCLEHLEILALLERGERAAAAALLARHLEQAGKEKVEWLRRGMGA